MPTTIKRPYPLPELRAGEYYVEPVDPATLTDSLYSIETQDPFDHFSIRTKSILYSGKTPFQEILIADTYNYGRALFMNGAIQSSAEDESLYHEMLVQPAMLLHPNPRDVLIIGGGEGATMREVLAHRIRTVTMVDIDQQAVEVCREYLPSWHRGGFADPRAHVIYSDGRAFVDNDTSKYDVVIIDVVDMLVNGPVLRTLHSPVLPCATPASQAQCDCHGTRIGIFLLRLQAALRHGTNFAHTVPRSA